MRRRTRLSVSSFNCMFYEEENENYVEEQKRDDPESCDLYYMDLDGKNAEKIAE